jgi:hypothetical protein
MGDLSNKFIDESYGSLLHTKEDTGLSGNTKSVVQDGNGVDTALKVSTEKVDVDGDLQTGGTDRITSTGELVNVSGDISQFTNDEGYISSIPTDVLRSGDNISELNNDSGYITSIPSNVMVEGENISLLNNDSGYISTIPSNVMLEGENISLLNNDIGYLSSIPSNVMTEGENVSLLNNDSGYLSSGDNVSELNNDSGYLTEVPVGFIKTENGSEIGTGRTEYTDGNGNKSGLFSWLEYGLNGISNTYDTSQSPQWTISNDNFSVLNFPMGSSSETIFSFTDFEGYLTYSILQNPYGSVKYRTQLTGQHHIFEGPDSSTEIVMQSFGSSNRSNNWFLGYRNSADDLTFDAGTGDLTLSRTDNDDLVVNIPSSSGGASDKYDHQVGWTAGLGLSFSTSQTLDFSSYAGYYNSPYFQPIYLSENNTYTKFKFFVSTADTSGSVYLSLGIYDSVISNASSLYSGIGLPTNRLVVNTAVPIDSTGMVEIEFAQPFTPVKSGLYWLGNLLEVGTSTTLAVRKFDHKTQSHTGRFPSSVIQENLDKDNGSIFNFYSSPQYPIVNVNSQDGIRFTGVSELTPTITYPTAISASLVGGMGISIYTQS